MSNSPETDHQLIAIVTGAAGGIGLEFARLLARDGYDLLLADADAIGLKNAEQQLKHQYDIEVFTIAADLTKPGVAEQIIGLCGQRQIAFLINNAGFGLKGAFTETDWHTEESMIQLHITFLTSLTKLCLRKMIPCHKGKIINVSSVAAFQAGPLMAVYYASKAYILSFSQAIAAEVKQHGIDVTVLCPGPTKTGFQHTVGSEHSVLMKCNLMASAEYVAAYGYKAVLKGKPIAIPGLVNKLIVGLERFLPKAFVANTVRWLQRKNDPRSLTS